MSAPYYEDREVTLHLGDSLAVLREMPDASVDCCVTSPPYFGLRDYGSEGQYGLESSPFEYVETMLALFSEVRRVLADDGTLWLNLGDSYMPSKSLLGIPWRVAFALRERGWTLRNEIVWHKPNAMPDPAPDRMSSSHEHLFMLSKSRHYWFNVDAVREPHTSDRLRGSGPRTKPGTGRNDATGATDPKTHPLGKNPGDVWSVPTVSFTEAHCAVMPPRLAERAILAGCKPGGVVLDPFSGSGTTGMAATKHGRKYVGIDISSEYLDLSLRTRFAQPGLNFEEAAGL